MLPTSGLGWDSEMEDDPALAAATMRAYNRWIEDDWGYAHEGRLFAPPCISLLDVDAAVTEVDRVLSAGARMVLVRTGPHAGRSPGHPTFDPVWARIAEAKVPVGLHVSTSGYERELSRWACRPIRLGRGQRAVAPFFVALWSLGDHNATKNARSAGRVARWPHPRQLGEGIGADMTADAIVQGLVEAFEAGDAGPILPHLAPGALTWHNHDNLDMDSAEGFASLAILRAMVDGLKLDVEEQLAIPGGVALRVVLRGTVKANGNELAGRNCLFLRIADGKITRIEEYVDPTFADQLGVSG